MTTHRLNIEFPSEDYTYLKMLCAEKGISIKDFVLPLILKAIEEEEDALLIKKAQKRLRNLNHKDLIPVEDAFKEAEWDV
jgi:predicted DNA-binding protein